MSCDTHYRGDPTSVRHRRTAGSDACLSSQSKVVGSAGARSASTACACQGSSDGGVTWQTIVTIAAVSSDQQWYSYTPTTHQSWPMIRVLDQHGGFTNVAEVELLKFQPLS
jgi:hypothetical protein